MIRGGSGSGILVTTLCLRICCTLWGTLSPPIRYVFIPQSPTWTSRWVGGFPSSLSGSHSSWPDRSGARGRLQATLSLLCGTSPAISLSVPSPASPTVAQWVCLTVSKWASQLRREVLSGAHLVPCSVRYHIQSLSVPSPHRSGASEKAQALRPALRPQSPMSPALQRSDEPDLPEIGRALCEIKS